MTKPNRYLGALDIGGTKILAGIIDPEGELATRRRITLTRNAVQRM